MPFVCLSVCLSVSNFARENCQMDLHENFITDVSVDKEELIGGHLDLDPGIF